ncbi:hypothetical protein GCM10010116_48760 [Microbispora rosea subsp. aerata]|nr:hypothetical protein GCM10010116_48760 [Microbispora rosea subsp. aerata]GIH57920.1 hypothetical protein Mro02_48340 [Microbispora rosea subsp. aerata]GLJ86858.1 hypothetical protein GCM10017588_55990 [Microbispora rosea subsp. aerata]
MGEVHHHLGAGQRVDRVVLVDLRHELQVIGRRDGLAHFHTYAPAGAQNTDLNHAPKAIRDGGRRDGEERADAPAPAAAGGAAPAKAVRRKAVEGAKREAVRRDPQRQRPRGAQRAPRGLRRHAQAMAKPKSLSE